MTKKQIESRIKMESKNVKVPDLRQEILARVPERKVVEPKKKKSFAIRLSYLMTIFIFALVTLLMINNLSFDNTGNGGNPGIIPTDPVLSISKTDKAYANGASTIVGFASGMETGISIMKSNISNTDSYTLMAEEIEKYFHGISRLLDEDGNVYEYIESDDENYQYKLIITNYVLDDEFQTTMYFNQKEIEKVIEIEGIVYPNGIEGNYLNFSGKEEALKDEKRVILTIAFSSNSYITAIIEEETEKDGVEFEYTYYFHTNKIKYIDCYKKISIEIENTKAGREIEIEVIEDGKKLEMEFVYDNDHVDKHVDIKFDGKDEFRVYEDEDDHDKYKYDHKSESGYENVHGGNKFHGWHNDYDDKTHNDRDDRKTV